jgi:serine phosphatase RsbU (regulator of sigma subunit)
VLDLAVAGLYVPAGPGPEPVTGDFYEVLPLADGTVALLVGDVAGHGRTAVGRMRQLRDAGPVCALQRRARRRCSPS